MSSQPPVDLIVRGVKKPSPAGTLTFIGLRPLGALLQFALLAQPSGWGVRLLSSLGLSTISASQSTSIAGGGGLILPFGLGTLPLPHLILALMATSEATKHIWWLTHVSYEWFPVRNALFVSGYNTVMDSLNSLLFLWAVTSTLAAGPRVSGLPLSTAVGAALFALGLGVEVVSEYQRRRFKEGAENQGKLFRGGLWAAARHPNYGGYVIWRVGYAMAAAGWVVGAAVGAIQFADFVTRGVPAVEGYCAKRYGEQWVRYEKKTKAVLIPGVY